MPTRVGSHFGPALFTSGTQGFDDAHSSVFRGQPPTIKVTVLTSATTKASPLIEIAQIAQAVFGILAIILAVVPTPLAI